MKVTCAITAGGKAKRFNGITKAFIEIKGEKIIDRNIKILNPIFDEIIIISNKADVFNSYSDFKIYSDYYINIGPIAGLHSAIKNSKNEIVFLLSSDLPNISFDIIESLIKKYRNTNCDILIPQIGNKIEPLFGLYRKSIINKLEDYIQRGKSYALRDFFKEVRTEFLELKDNPENRNAFKNINEPSDLDTVC